MSGDKIKRFVVIGASAGGFEALAKLLNNVSSNIQAAFLVVVHLAHNASGEGLTNYLKRQTALKVKLTENNESIEPGHIYIAPPDFHMLVKDNKILITNGPMENKYRPSIDQLFRSAAVNFRGQAIGIILSGLLDDGTSGMIAIKKTGGTLVIQDPFEAAFSDMPLSVKGNVKVDHICSINDMATLLQKLIEEPARENLAVPDDLRKEVEIAERVLVGLDQVKKVGNLTPFICPDCGGALWEHDDDDLTRFRCHTGHVFTANVLLQEKSQEVEESIWVAIRVLEEKRNLLVLMAEKDKIKGGPNWQSYERRSKESKIHIDRLKELILSSNHFSEVVEKFKE